MAETEWSTIEAGSPPEQEKVEFEIEGQEATEEAKDQLRISRFYGKKPKKVEFKSAKLISGNFS